MPPKNLGAIERPKDPRDILLGAVQAPVALPTTLGRDLSWLTRNYQGQTAFCGEHAGTHFKTLLDYYGTNGAVNIRKNPRYGAIKLKDPKSPVYDGFAIDAGTTMPAIFKWQQNVGAADYEPLENDVTLPLTTYCDPSVITPAMDASAAASKIASYAFDALTFNDICQTIYQRTAILILAKVDDGFWGTSTPTFTDALYGHFFVGYDFDRSTNDLLILDSADPSNQFALKRINAKYITPQFFFETGTAIDIPPRVKNALITNAAIPSSAQQAVSAGQLTLAEQILQDIEQALSLIQKEL